MGWDGGTGWGKRPYFSHAAVVLCPTRPSPRPRPGGGGHTASLPLELHEGDGADDADTLQRHLRVGRG